MTLRSAVIAAGLIVLSSFWVQKVSLISHTCQVSEGTPSVPALMGLLLLTGIVLALGLRRGPVRQELLVIYAMVSLGASLSSDNVMRQLFPAVTSLRYFAAPENDYALLAQQLPPWLAVADDEAARGFCEGTEGGAIPWAPWVRPLLVWAAVFLGFGLASYCLFALFDRPWAQYEHLGYPLVELALDIAPGGDSGTRHHVLGQPLFWVGFGLGALFNAQNIAHAFSPQLPALGYGYDLGNLFTQRPWSGIRPLYLAFRPEIVGLGYMVPLDILFSSWLFYLVLRMENLVALALGHETPGFPFDEPQAMGAYLGLVGMVVYGARHHLRAAIKSALGGSGLLQGRRMGRADRAVRTDPEEAPAVEDPMAYGLLLWGALGGLVGLVFFGLAAGISPHVSVPYALLSWVMILVYGRIRAQTGLPISYIVPRRDVYKAIRDLWATPGRLSPAQLHTEANFALLTVVNRMTFPQMGAFEMEAVRMGEAARIRRAHIFGAILLALLIGIAMGYWTHIAAAYEYGNNTLDGGTTEGGFRTRQSLWEFDVVQERNRLATPVILPPVIARGAGLAITVGLLWLRSHFLRFPIHPMGLAIAASFGYHIWFPIFLVWLIKSLVLRLGGARLYRQLAAAFLGLAVGHMLIAGGVWGLVGTVDEDVAKRYLVWFT